MFNFIAKTIASIGAIGLALSFTPKAFCQALPTATAAGSLQVGAGYTIASPDYGQKNIQGITVFADYDLGVHLGIEAVAHVIELQTPTDIAENSYMAGVRYIFPIRQRIHLYAKGVAGIGNFRVLETQDNQDQHNGNYFAYALGGGVDIPVSNKIVIRAIDFEYSKWPNWPPNGLSPIVYTFGVAYHFR